MYHVAPMHPSRRSKLPVSAGSVSGLDLEPGGYVFIDGALWRLPDPADFSFADHGSVTILTPLNEQAKAWVKEHIDPDHFSFGRGIAIEHRYAGDILSGIVNDGFSVEAA